MRLAVVFAAIVALAVSSFYLGYRAHGPVPLRPCVTEDSDGPCYWDATARGNGHGRSFVVDAHNRVIYIGSPS